MHDEALVCGVRQADGLGGRGVDDSDGLELLAVTAEETGTCKLELYHSMLCYDKVI